MLLISKALRYGYMTRIDCCSDNIFHLTNGVMSYYLMADEDNIYSIYWGKYISDITSVVKSFEPEWSSFDYEEISERTEFDIFDGRRYTRPSIKGEGKYRIGKLKRVGYDIENNTLTLRYSAYRDNLEIVLKYSIYDSVIKRDVSLASKRDEIRLTNSLSGAVSLPRKTDGYLSYVNGRWLSEWQENKTKINIGTFIIESRKGVTSASSNPSVLISEKEDGEECDCWSIMLGYSGNWELDVEKTTLGTTRISAGINSFDNLLSLRPGDVTSLPSIYLAYSPYGKDSVMQEMHNFQRKHLIPKRKMCRVLYNSWEATGFDVNEENQLELAKKAASIGTELFVVDDGWFSNRDSDKSGLGDWFVSTRKFPKGLGHLIQEVKSLGMDFGIWVEPESVNPDSILYRTHPDWIYSIEGVEPRLARNQYVLDIGKREVKRYILSFMRTLLSENDISFIKWDFNRAITDPDSFANTDSREIWHKHVESLYSIWKTLREEFPHVEFETCSGGGGRVDLGIMQYANQFWLSDNTDPYSRIRMQYSAMQFYNPSSMMSWVTDAGKDLYSLDYRFIVSMCVGLGIGANISKYSDKEIAKAKEWVDIYKDIRDIIAEGKAYRIGNPYIDDVSAIEYVSNDNKDILIFAFADKYLYGNSISYIKLKGISNESVYMGIDGKEYSSLNLMHIGIPIKRDSGLSSTFVHLKRQ